MLFCKKLSVFLLIMFLSGCGFQPVFGTRDTSIITSEMKFIEIRPISNKVGQILRNQLVQNIQPLGKSKTTKYRLNVRLKEHKQRLAIKKSEIATRANLSFIANYEIFSKASGALLTQGTSHMISSYNILTHTYATLIAEKDARNRAIREIAGDITSKLASFFRLNKDKLKRFK